MHVLSAWVSVLCRCSLDWQPRIAITSGEPKFEMATMQEAELWKHIDSVQRPTPCQLQGVASWQDALVPLSLKLVSKNSFPSRKKFTEKAKAWGS